MKKSELKKILKPLIKECIKEVIFEEGTLSTIISEVVKGTGSTSLISEQRIPQRIQQPDRLETAQESKQRRKDKLKEHKAKLMNSIGRDTYNGVNIFEGTTPTSSRGNNSSSPHGSNALDGVAPHDPGVDLSSFGLPTGIWKKLAGS